MELHVTKETRTEKDSLGTLDVPHDAWYGIQTARAVENFKISGRRADPDFIVAHVRIKRAAAIANRDASWLDPPLAQAIVDACDKILAGQYLDQFVVDRFQAGAGTSHNMNANEIIANLASVALGGERGAYRPVHPNDHVNMGQSTNDTIPTAIRLAALAKLPRLLDALNAMAVAFEMLGKQEAAIEDRDRRLLGRDQSTVERHRDHALAPNVSSNRSRIARHERSCDSLLYLTAGTPRRSASGFANPWTVLP